MAIRCDAKTSRACVHRAPFHEKFHLPGAIMCHGRSSFLSGLLQQLLTQCLSDGAVLSHVGANVSDKGCRLRIATGHCLKHLWG